MSALLEQSSALSLEKLKSLSYPTPFLVMDLSNLTQRYQELFEALTGIQLHYAMKCNPDARILSHLDGLGCRFEIASLAELEMLQSVGVDPKTVLFSNPVKPISHIQGSFAAGLTHFSFDSIAEIQKLATHAPGASVYVRLATEDATSEVASEGKFGVGISQAIALMMEARRQGLHPAGIAFHVGSQMTTPAAWVRAIEASGKLMQLLADIGIHLQFLDIGGGFPAHYGTYQPDFKLFGEVISAALATQLPYSVDVIAEPGRSLVAEAGVMVASVIGIASRNGKRWVHLDVGAFNGMMESLETRNALQFPLRDSQDSAVDFCNLTGPSCDSQDTILFQVPLSQNLAVGDKVYLYSAGAYTTSYASNFNGFSIPEVYCIGV